MAVMADLNHDMKPSAAVHGQIQILRWVSAMIYKVVDPLLGSLFHRNISMIHGNCYYSD